ncbi:hypothetical protein GCM10009725_30120 [Aeromicrobium tamlense]
MSTNASPTEPNTNARLAALEEQVEQLLEENSELRDRVDDLEQTTDEKDERIAELETELQRVEGNLNVAINQGSTNKDRIKELQGRELEKGAHLLEENVPKGDKGEGDYGVDVADGRLEKVQKEDGEVYLRMPETDDPIGRGGSTTLAHADLLPIQQLAQMDDDMLQSSTSDLPSELAAKLWKARDGSNDRPNPWREGSGEVREYVKSSDIKSWILRQEGDIKDEYAKKLVSRTISRLIDYSNNRVAVQKKNQRKNGLTYKERFVEIRADVQIPGETAEKKDQPETTGVLG